VFGATAAYLGGTPGPISWRSAESQRDTNGEKVLEEKWSG